MNQNPFKSFPMTFVWLFMPETFLSDKFIKHQKDDIKIDRRIKPQTFVLSWFNSLPYGKLQHDQCD